MKTLLLLMLFPVCGCGPHLLDFENGLYLAGGTFIPRPAFDSSLAPYLPEFIEDAAYYGLDVDASRLLVLIRKELPEDQIGLCQLHWSDISTTGAPLYAEIYIDPAVQCEAQLRATLYHEFGHCLLYQEHTRQGIMRDYSYSCEYYEYNWDSLVAEQMEIRP